MNLLDNVKRICDRLAEKGWKALFLQHGLDITSMNLKGELLKELTGINRSVSGFEDFSLEGKRGIEPGMPARSLLYHALASPNVVEGVTEFPTLAELETIENYVYGIEPPALEEIRARAEGLALSLVVFATEYRPSSDTVHKKHADLCFSRTGVARVGTAQSEYAASIRGFLPFVDNQPHAIRVLPAKYSAYIAVQRRGNKEQFGPMRFKTEDSGRIFWVPLHKLFSGAECIHGMELHVSLTSHHVNEKLKRIHQVLKTGVSEEESQNKPFKFTDGIAELSLDPELGTGVVMPIQHPALVERAEDENGKPITFKVPANNNPLYSSFTISDIDGARRAPEYVHVRHVLNHDGTIKDLNEERNVSEIVKEGNYDAVHYIDYTGDGWVEARCPEISNAFPDRHPAYSLVTAPDFFPSCDQRELMDWTESVPGFLKPYLWEVPPETLSDNRLAANIHLGEGQFTIDDRTMTAVVSTFYETPPRQANVQPTRVEARHSYLPDAASGVFAPGWDVSSVKDHEGAEFLAAYGLGSPFPEDAKLCAALSTFWPAVAPDAARTFEPSHQWPTVSPLTDEEIGQAGGLPWDGIQGPSEIPGKNMVRYAAMEYADYVDQALGNKFTLALTGKIDVNEYQERVLSMACAYHALGINPDEKGEWSVLSFRKAEANDNDLGTAQRQSGTVLSGPLYRFVMYRHGAIFPDPDRDFTKRAVMIEEKAELFVGGEHILVKRGEGKWVTHSIFTHA
ncbi:hypothetical protein ACFFSY_17415 [Paenibacillus aurantiacus]|uniref:Uncharacterized protein n=1 Tax=Paenibacillus aurantiacus TaxID=1936118 RepID=A0ABV5KR84_9BACL